MGSTLKRLLLIIAYFIFWLSVYAVLYLFSSETVVLLPHFRSSYAIETVLISFITVLPALESVIILLNFTSILCQYSTHRLKKGSPLLLQLSLKLLFMCIVASTFNITSYELIRPNLISAKNNQLTLSQKYYENINRYSEAIKDKDYKQAEQSLKIAFSIWDESPEIPSLQAQLATLQDNATRLIGSAKTYSSSIVSIPESLSPLEILNIARDRMATLDFYTAYNYASLALKMAKDDAQLQETAFEMKTACMEKISSGASMDKILEEQYRFEAKKSAYDALSQKDYEKAYYSFLELHDDILSKTNKYDPDVERYLEIAKQRLSEQVFFIEEVQKIHSFNSGYSIRFKCKKQHASFNIASFYCSHKKDGISIYLSNLIYSQDASNSSPSFQIKMPYAKIIEKEVNGKKELFLLGEARSQYSLTKNIPINDSILGYEKYFPLPLGMSAHDFDLIALAQQETSAMNILNLYSFFPIAKNYGFDSTVYTAEICMRLADFFMFMIFTVLFATLSFYLRPEQSNISIFHFFIAGLAFPYLFFIFVDSARQILKFCSFILISTGIPFPVFSILLILFLLFIFTASKLYNLGYD